MTELSERGKAFREAIIDFVDERRKSKLKEAANDPEKTAKYDVDTWVGNAIARSSHIEVVTHVLKATHSQAKGTNIYAPPTSLPQGDEIGTHSLGDVYDYDIAIDNALHLDIYSFLRTPCNGKQLLDFVINDDKDLQSALNDDQELAAQWMATLRKIVSSNKPTVSDPLAKQIFWLIGEQPTNNRDFHLLQPMISSSLEQAIFTEITVALFGEENKNARHAFRERKASSVPYKQYKNIVKRKIGGNNTQNVSARNLLRGGANYLLSSFPPTWRTDDRIKILNTNSAVERFGHTPVAKALVKHLAEFLLGNPPATEPTRKTRERLEQALADELAAFGAQITAQMPAGWTQDPACTLHESEKLWLDGGRTELPLREGHEQEDTAFNAAYTWGDWPDDVAGRFANWVNERLRAAGLTAVGDVEARHWARQAIIDTAWPIPQQRRAGGAA